MKNKIFFKTLLILLFSLISSKSFGSEQFNFNITEIEILDNGNKFKGTKRGQIKTNTGVIIDSNNFTYLKNKNIFKAEGNVKIEDKINRIFIFSEKITYLKDKEIIYTSKRSRAKNDKISIYADIFQYNKKENILIAEGKVKIENEEDNYLITGKKITYLINEQKIYTEGKTFADIKSQYNFNSKNVLFLINESKLSSKNKTIIKDTNSNIYNLDKFIYSINEKELKGSNILITTNFGLPKSDKFYFSNAIINLKNQNFIAKDTKILIHNEIFGESNNEPRLYGVSSSSKNNITKINKGVFTSCGDKDKCPPWSISAKKIEHNKNKKIISYENAVLKIYDAPVFYFPKFFHPDPTVKRQSGLLQPQINDSNVLGESIYIPYFHVISDTKDFTFKPTIFENNMQMFRNEYRQLNQNSSFIADFSLTRGYKSSASAKKNSISHLFAKFKSDLKYDNFNTSDLYLSVQKISKDTYLKVFDTNLIDTDSELKPADQNTLISEVKLTLDKDNFDFTTGIQSFENLQQGNSDRYQYILPYYEFNTNIYPNIWNGEIDFKSIGDNNLKNTNVLETRIINDLEYRSFDLITNSGFVNNYNFFIKNLTTLGKNTNIYKSSPQIELMNIIEANTSIPFKKNLNQYTEYLTPKISLRINPSDMKNYSSSERKINSDNIYDINRLGLLDSFEAGKSLTFGIEYKREKLEDINKFFELKVASSFKDKENNFVPSTSSLNKKNSNIFGSLTSTLSDFLILDYDFILDNNFDKFEYNSLNTTLKLKNISTNFNFVEENGLTGDTNFLENTTSYELDEQNALLFKTRRNRKLNLTEYYDLVYEYKNDCLIASIKYNKTYYADRDLKPVENLFFSISLFPLTTYEHSVDKSSLDRLK